MATEIKAQVLLFPFMGILNESENISGYVRNILSKSVKIYLRFLILSLVFEMIALIFFF